MDKKEIEQNEKALKEFLLDIDSLEPISEWTNKINIFDILKVSRAEIRHSNMLAWLLNPNENHGLGDSILQGFIQYVSIFLSNSKDVFNMLLMDSYDFVVLREWRGIDVLLVSSNEKIVICIENKIGAKESGNQLDRYRGLIEENYPNYNNVFIYLSPKGEEASDSENWWSMSYRDVVDIIEKAKTKVVLLPEVNLLIDNYVDTIRRDIVGDERLAQLCADIYAKHQKALDLIIDNRPDRALELAKIFRRWASEKDKKGEIVYSSEYNGGKTYTRFMTKTMSTILPDAEKARSGWGTKNYYFYEITFTDKVKDYYIQFVVTSKEIPDDLRTICDRIQEIHPARNKKKDWQWRTHFSTNKNKTDDELDEEKIFKNLDKMFEKICEFEADIKNKLNDK